MKRNIKKSSRRKWVVGGIAFFGSVALLTTGFATWVVGVNDNNEEGSVSVNVETTTNNSVSFTMEYASENADNSITIDEPTPLNQVGEDGKGYVKKTGDIIQPGEGTSKFDFTITFAKVNISIGNTAYKNPTTKYDSIKFAIKEGSGNEVKSAGNKIGNARSGNSWKYLTAPATQTFTELKLVESTNESSHIFTGTNVALTFSWGDFFGNDSPCAYYNKLYHNSSLDDLGGDTQIVNAIYQEMDALSKAFASKTLTLTATLAVSSDE